MMAAVKTLAFPKNSISILFYLCKGEGAGPSEKVPNNFVVKNCFKDRIIQVSWINLAKLGCIYWAKRFPSLGMKQHEWKTGLAVLCLSSLQPSLHTFHCVLLLFLHTFLGFGMEGIPGRATRAELGGNVNYNLLLELNGTEIFPVPAVPAGIVAYN